MALDLNGNSLTQQFSYTTSLLYGKSLTRQVTYTTSHLHDRSSTRQVTSTRIYLHGKLATRQSNYTASQLLDKTITRQVSYSKKQLHGKSATRQNNYAASQLLDKATTRQVSYLTRQSHGKSATRQRNYACDRNCGNSMEYYSPMDSKPKPCLPFETIIRRASNSGKYRVLFCLSHFQRNKMSFISYSSRRCLPLNDPAFQIRNCAPGFWRYCIPDTTKVDDQLGRLARLVSESACEREDPGSNLAADMVDAARNTAWDLASTNIYFQPTQIGALVIGRQVRDDEEQKASRCLNYRRSNQQEEGMGVTRRSVPDQDVLLYTSLTSLCLAAMSRYSFRLRCPASNGGSTSASPYQHGIAFAVRRITATCLLVTWVIIIAAVAPQATFIQYFDLEASLGTQFRSVGLCIVGRSSGFRRYNGVLFVLLYCLPLAVSSAIHHRIYTFIMNERLVRNNLQLEDRQNSVQDRNGRWDIDRRNWNTRKQSPCSDTDAQYEEFDYTCFDRDPGAKESSPVYEEISLKKLHLNFIQISDDVVSDNEGRGQIFRAAMTVVCGVTLAPLMVVRLTNSTSTMTSAELDIMTAWLALLSLLHTVSTPILFLCGHCTVRKTTSDSVATANQDCISRIETGGISVAASLRGTPVLGQRKSSRSLLRSEGVRSFEETIISNPQPPPLPSRPPPVDLPLQLSSSSGCILQPPWGKSPKGGNISPCMGMYPMTNYEFKTQRNRSLHSPRSFSESIIPVTPPNSPNHRRLTPTLSFSFKKPHDSQSRHRPSHIHFQNFTPATTPQSLWPDSATLSIHQQVSPLHSRTTSSLSFCHNCDSPRSPMSLSFLPSTASPLGNSSHRLMLPAESLIFGQETASGRLLTPARSRTIHRISNDKRVHRR
ncbi:hypothetical protein FHG87_002187 [Trinorchestia longiramus]|nr:hypothetical protein FHG87_002187 [Trinorchestia longiramus]